VAAGRSNPPAGGLASRDVPTKAPDGRWPCRMEGQSALTAVSLDAVQATTLQPQPQWMRGASPRDAAAMQTGPLCATSSEGVLVPPRRPLTVEGSRSQAGASADGGTPSASGCALNHSLELLVLGGGGRVPSRRLGPSSPVFRAKSLWEPSVRLRGTGAGQSHACRPCARVDVTPPERSAASHQCCAEPWG